MYLHHFSIHICFPYWWVRWWKGLWCKMSSKPVPQYRKSIAICWINKSGSKYLQIRWWVCFTVRKKCPIFPSHVGQAGLRGEREPEGTTVRLKLDEAQVNGIHIQVCWSLGFTRQRKQFQREVWRACIPRADSLIPKVKFLSRGDNKDTYAVQTSFKRVLGTLRFYATYLNSKCQVKNLERLQVQTFVSWIKCPNQWTDVVFVKSMLHECAQLRGKRAWHKW